MRPKVAVATAGKIQGKNIAVATAPRPGKGLASRSASPSTKDRPELATVKSRVV
jgi:hypothetical protein